MRIGTALIAFVMTLPSMPAGACSLGTHDPSIDIPLAVRDSDEIFVAKLTGYSQFASAESGYYMGRMEYALEETIKGSPSTLGSLFESTGIPAKEGTPPAPACGPWVVTRNNVGQEYVVFATRYASSGHLIPHPYSIRLDPTSAESIKLLDFVRSIQSRDSTP